MKLTMILLTAGFLNVSAKSLSQNVTFSGQNVPLKTAFASIEKQTGFVFLYKVPVLQSSKPVSISAENVPLEQFLSEIFKSQPLKYTIKGKSIFISLRSAVAGSSDRQHISNGTFDLLQDTLITVRGRILNEKGEPVIASVIVKGTKRGTTTDVNGNFELKNINGNSLLIISSVGFEIKALNALDIALSYIVLIRSINAEEEVIIRTDYFGSTKRKSTMNISKVNAKDIENQPVTSLMNALIGRVPGLDITPVNGAAGSASLIQIRGRNSLYSTASSLPLYIIDGIQIDSKPLDTYSSNNYVQGFDPLSSISPSDIESIEVLKDAVATAIYGSRGANGVIRITTKRAKKAAKNRLDVNMYSGFGTVANKAKVLSREDYLKMRHEAYSNAGTTPEYYIADLAGIWDTLRYTDWQDALLGGTANYTDVQGNFAGGNENNSFRVGAGYHKETTIYPGEDGFQRANGTFSFNHISPNKKLFLNANMNFGWANNNSYSNNTFVNDALTIAPVAPQLYNDDGSLNWQLFEYAPGIFFHTWTNPVSKLLNTDRTVTNSLLSTINFSYEFLPGLKVAAAVSVSRFDNNQIIKNPIIANPPYYRPGAMGTAYFNRNNRQSIMVEPKISYTKQINAHHVDIMLGSTWQSSSSLFEAVRGDNYPSDAFMESIRGAATIRHMLDRNVKYKYASVYAHFGYDFKDKYLVDLTARRDGSSRFGPKKRYGNFGAVGIGWIFSDESFMHEISHILSFGKLRGSFGLTGNDQIGDYAYLNTYSILSLGYQGGISLSPTALFNPNYSWEKTRKLEVALELAFLKSRISIEAAWYRNRSSNQLTDLQLPDITGFASVLGNLDAIVQNTGWEGTIITKNIQSSNFSWTTAVNISIPKNTLIKFNGIETSPYKERYKVGEPLSIQYIYTFKGVNPQTGLFEIEDVNNDGIYNNDDRRFMKPLDRQYYGGINNSFIYKNVDLSFLVQFSKMPIGNYLPTAVPGSASNQLDEVLNRWQKPGDIKPFQKYVVDDPNGDYINNVLQSDYNTTNASFFRLKTLSMGYNFSKSWLNRLNLQDTRLYLQGQNLFTSTNFNGLDPESGNSLPPVRILAIGLQVKI